MVLNYAIPATYEQLVNYSTHFENSVAAPPKATELDIFSSNVLQPTAHL